MRIASYLSLAVGAALVAGCGGQSSTSLGGGRSESGWNQNNNGFNSGGRNMPGANGNSQTTELPIFISAIKDAPGEQFWVKIYQVNLISNKGPIPVFESTDGVALELNNLKDKEGPRFSFFGQANVDGGDLVRAEIILDPNYTVLKKDQSEAMKGTFASSLKTPEGKTRLVMNLNPRGLKNGYYALVLDIDSNRTAGDKDKAVLPVIHEGSKAGVESKDRHERADWVGHVTGLSGVMPAMAFSLKIADTRLLRTLVTPNTQLVAPSESKEPNVTLAENQQVLVRGQFDPVQKTLLASTLRILSDKSRPAPFSASGDLKVLAGEDPDKPSRFALSTKSAIGFIPAAVSVVVAPDAKTEFLGLNGLKVDLKEFLSQLPNSEVVVDGTYQESTTSFVPTSIRLESPVNASGKPKIILAEADGNVLLSNNKAQTLKIKLTNKIGFELKTDELAIISTQETKFQDEEGKDLKVDEFFTKAIASQLVHVKGVYSNGKIVASKLNLAKPAEQTKSKEEETKSKGTPEPLKGNFPTTGGTIEPVKKPETPPAKPETPPTKPETPPTGPF